MKQETKKCQNCKKDFIIETEDFNFYEKIKVPPPTWCPECRLIRRLTWRNERTLYKRSCDLCNENIIAMYKKEAIFPVYCHKCWNSDKWNPLDYGKNYDFSKPFFEQYKELLDKVPRVNLWQLNTINSTFSNLARNCKDVYLSYSLVGGEKIYYSKIIDGTAFRLFDCLSVADSENCYEIIYGTHNYNSQFLFESNNCINCSFLYGCVNCHDCFMSSNLRNGEFVYYNKQLSKKEYFEKINNIFAGSYKKLQMFKNNFKDLISKSLSKYAVIIKSVNSNGDHILNARNATFCFDVHDVENVKYCFRILDNKDIYDASFFGGPGELAYEYISGGSSSHNVVFCMNAVGSLQDALYSDFCNSVKNIFGCIGLKNKEFCVLNKKYSKEEYQKLLILIEKQMKEIPYTGNNGRLYKYGDFFPVEISPFSYNETIAQEYFPISKQEAEIVGYKWNTQDKKQYEIMILPEKLPDKIDNVSVNILNEVIGCEHKNKCLHQCTGAFRIIADELQFYKQFKLPIPHLCPNCRHYERLVKTKPLKLWHRICMCERKGHDHPGKCQNEFETSYSPDRSEKVYCESCYNKEIY